MTLPRCLKITEKVPFNIASEASYVYILRGQTLIKNSQFGEFEKLKLDVKSVTTVLIGQKIGGKCQIKKFQMIHFE